MAPRWLAFALAWMCLAGSGCGKRPPETGAAVVRKIKFKGNGGLLSGRSNTALRSVIEQGQSKGPGFIRWLAPRRLRVRLDDRRIADDGWRLEAWYAHQGFFDARFRGWEVVVLRPRRVKPNGTIKPRVVKLVGLVKEGPETTVRDVDWQGMETVGRPLVNLLDRKRDLKEGDRFTVEAVESTRQMALGQLHDRSFAHSTLEPRVDAYPAQEPPVADVTYHADLGPPSVFGEIRIQGNAQIKDKYVLREVDIAEGEAYSASALAQTRQNLFGLGTFSVVNVEPQLEQTPDGSPSATVPVRVDLKEGKFRQIKAGGAIAVEGATQQGLLRSSFRHVNVFNTLTHLDVEVTGGYRSFATIEDISLSPLALSEELERGPIASGELAIRVPWTPWEATTTGFNLLAEHDLNEGWESNSLQGQPSLTWRLAKDLRLELSYNLVLFRYLSLNLSEADIRQLDIDPDETGLLSYFGQSLIIGKDPILTRRNRGVYSVLSLHEAGGVAGGDFRYLRTTADIRGYRPILRLFELEPRLETAARIGGGYIHLYGPDDGKRRVRPDERLYLGGSSNYVRGWTLKHLGPYECEEGVTCIEDGRQVSPEITPIGGLVSTFGSVEVRHYYPNDVGWVLFSDAGMAWESLDAVDLGEVAFSVGVGARYRSPIGPIRLDLARRLDVLPRFAAEPRWGLHFAIGEAF